MFLLPLTLALPLAVLPRMLRDKSTLFAVDLVMQLVGVSCHS
jgi:hypothetical protein